MPLRRENVFRLRRNLFYWDKRYDAPFVKVVHQGLFRYVQNRFPEFDWDQELDLARRDFRHVETWESLPLQLEKPEIHIPVYDQAVHVALSKVLWCLLYPDYLLITYPLWPPGKQKTVFPEAKLWLNPLYHYPSRYWHLPDQVYSYFEGLYGLRRPEEIRSGSYMKYLEHRARYCEYFARKFKLPSNHFELVTGTRVKAQPTDIREIIQTF